MTTTGSAAVQTVRDVVARIDVDALTAQLVADLRDEPAYRRFVRDERLRDRGPAVVRWNLELFGRWLADGRPPSMVELDRIGELVRIRAEEGLPIEDGLRVYRRGARLGWDTVLRMATPDERQALLEGSAIYLDYVELVADAFLAAYADAAQAHDPTEARARDLMGRLRRAAPGPHEQVVAEQLGIDLRGAVRPFAAAITGTPVALHAALAAELRAGGVLACVRSGGVVGVAPAGADPTATVARVAPAATVACADDDGWAALDAVLEELATVVALGAAAGRAGHVRAEDFLVDLLLSQAPRARDRIVARVLGRLDADQATTLRALVTADFDRSAAARALPVHRNTMLQRVQRIEATTGLDLRRINDQVLVALAVRPTR
ncbi:MAG: helix-turn-helix domain-containing protein [Patulibacter sp.]|nr:helix-turn-helix domain-containing protein [Patulibacter sp.]